jgi:hypothetical protein
MAASGVPAALAAGAAGAPAADNKMNTKRSVRCMRILLETRLLEAQKGFNAGDRTR